jgi:hypothetical protein
MNRLRTLLRAAAACVIAACILTAATAQTQSPQSDSFFARWQARANETQDAQPHWSTPVATSTPKIDQAMRAEFSRQSNSAAYRTWDLGNNKGLELIPARRTEIIFGVPPFFEHAQPGVKNGFGDTWFQAKYQFAAANEQHGNYAVTAILYATIPTGKDANGSCCAVVTPALAGGKGWGRWAVMSLASGTLPVTGEQKLGHAIAWSNVLEYRVGAKGFTKLLVPEVESNTNFYLGGANDGKLASFLTPGLVFGRIPLSHTATRRSLTLAAGEQIAVTHYHPYNHGLIVSVRLPF